MNAATLKALIDRLRADEAAFRIQKHLTRLNEGLTAFASQPQQPEHQLQVSNALNALENALAGPWKNYDAAWRRRMDSIGATEFFSPAMTDEIRRVIAENPMMPAVVRDFVGKILKRRAEYLQTLEAAANSLQILNIAAEELEPGAAEIGFQLPHELFGGDLEGLIKELRDVKRIIRVFSELATGSIEPIKVREISTSDPLFFFGLEVETIAMIGITITWALDAWKRVEEIRKLRSETSKNKSFTEEEIEKFFGDKIRKTIHEAIDEKAAALIADNDGKAGRKKEQRIDLEWALKSILARIERGMTVEIRFLPPVQPQVADGESTEAEGTAFKTLQEMVPQLRFPEPDPSPVIALPPSEPKHEAARKTKTDAS